MNPGTDGKLFSIRDLAILGMMVAALEAVKRALDFLPNVELVTLLFIVFTLYYGRKTLLAALTFTLLETFFWGVHNWVIMYLYIWPLLILIVHYTRKHAGHFFYCMLSAVFGLLFGAMCSLPYLIAGGPGAAFAWWIAGIPYDIIHCVSNFLLCLILYKPLTAAMNRIQNSEVK